MYGITYSKKKKESWQKEFADLVAKESEQRDDLRMKEMPENQALENNKKIAPFLGKIEKEKKEKEELERKEKEIASKEKEERDKIKAEKAEKKKKAEDEKYNKEKEQREKEKKKEEEDRIETEEERIERLKNSQPKALRKATDYNDEGGGFPF